MLRTVALLLSAATLLPAQTGGAVDGSVTNRATGAGIAGVAVTVYTREALRYEATTDAAGVFRIQNIRPGRYEARYEKDGFTGYPAGSFDIAAGQSAYRLRLEMTQYITVRGRVFDNEGKPTAKAEVQLAGAPVKVNDRGEFKVENVEPGSYTLRASPIGARPVSGDQDRGEQDRTALVPTYFPNAIDSTAAERILVRGDADLDGFEIHLQSVPVYRVSGIVRDQLGNPAKGAKVRLLPVQQQPVRLMMNVNGEFLTFAGPGLGRGPEESNTVSAEDGMFEFPSVRSGDWEIAAQVMGSIDSVNFIETVRNGTIIATVGRSDLDRLEIRLAAPFALAGTIDWGDAQSQRPVVMLSPADSPSAFFGGPGGGPGGNQPAGAFTMPRVSPGQYYVIPQFGAGYYPVSVLLGGSEIFGQRVGLVPGSPPLRITYKAARGSVSGTVENGTEASVILLPQQVRTMAFARMVRARPDGTFEIAGVVPGDYYAVAVGRLDRMRPDSALQDPGFLSRIATIGVRVRVEQSAASPIQLKPIRWPE